MPVLDFFLDERSPFDRTFTIAKGARRPQLQVKILDGSTPVSVTNATVTFSMEDRAGTLKVNAQAGSIVNAAEGIVGYDFAAVDVDTLGIFFAQFSISIGGTAFLVPNNDTQKLRIVVVAKVE